MIAAFISIHALREEGDLAKFDDRNGTFISIHALREEGDKQQRGYELQQRNFYPRPPRGGRRTSITPCSQTWAFLSTPSARRATAFWLNLSITSGISIHALREEGDTRHIGIALQLQEFLSTPSARRATEAMKKSGVSALISIHALREEGDQAGQTRKIRRKNFYPRPPRGGRQQKQRQNLYFQTNCTTFCTNLEEP